MTVRSTIAPETLGLVLAGQDFARRSQVFAGNADGLGGIAVDGIVSAWTLLRIGQSTLVPTLRCCRSLGPISSRCRVTDEETRILKQARFSDADVVELLSTISLGLMFTSMTRGADILIDERFRVPGYYRPWERLDG